MKSRFLPYGSQYIDSTDRSKILKVLKSNFLTQGPEIKRFEDKFAKYVGSKYALMVNSGSSANLLSFFALINPKTKKKLQRNDECLIPALCWSTSLWPIIQHGLKPIFVDIDLNNLNIDLDKLKKKITKKTKAIFCVHVLGLSADMFKLKK